MNKQSPWNEYAIITPPIVLIFAHSYFHHQERGEGIHILWWRIIKSNEVKISSPFIAGTIGLARIGILKQEYDVIVTQWSLRHWYVMTSLYVELQHFTNVFPFTWKLVWFTWTRWPVIFLWLWVIDASQSSWVIVYESLYAWLINWWLKQFDKSFSQMDCLNFHLNYIQYSLQLSSNSDLFFAWRRTPGPESSDCQ